MLRSHKPGSYEEALIHLKQVHNANCHHLVIHHKLKLTMKLLIINYGYFL